MESGELPPVGGLGGFPRGSVRTFLARFDGAVLEVALEATTGWRFLVEEIQRVGAEAHLAEPAETSGLKGKKQRAKTDWADARHLRELLLIGRLPESWIAPAHLLDLRARVRCRHTLVHQRTEWQQRMHAVLYHHGVPHARKLLTLANRERIAALKLPAAAREQLTIATEMIDAIEIQIGPVDLALRAIARTQPGCRTLIDQIYGIGPLTSVTILAELSELSALDAQHHGETLLAMLVGGLFGLLSAFTVVETSPRQLAATMVLAPIPMLAAMGLAIEFVGHRTAGIAVMAIVMGIGTWFPKLSPWIGERAFFFGQMLFVGYLIGFLSHGAIKDGQLGWIAAILWFSAAVNFVLKVVIFAPLSRGLRRTIRAFSHVRVV
jgi:hypothetical protein